MEIKETMDICIAMEAIADAIGAALEDGKLTVLDLAKLVPAIGPAREALAGVSLVKEELMDLDKEEVAALTAEMFVVVKKFVNALSVKV